MQVVCIMGGSKTGKSTVEKKLSQMGFKPSVSYTTRGINTNGHIGEVNGVDYNFITREQFNELINKGLVIEYEEIYGNLYGTPKFFGSSRHVAVVGLNGNRAIKKMYNGQVLSVYLKADDKTLHERYKLCGENYEESTERINRTNIDKDMTVEMEKEADIVIDSTIGVDKIVCQILSELKRRREG